MCFVKPFIALQNSYLNGKKNWRMDVKFPTDEGSWKRISLYFGKKFVMSSVCMNKNGSIFHYWPQLTWASVQFRKKASTITSYLYKMSAEQINKPIEDALSLENKVEQKKKLNFSINLLHFFKY